MRWQKLDPSDTKRLRHKPIAYLELYLRAGAGKLRRLLRSFCIGYFHGIGSRQNAFKLPLICIAPNPSQRGSPLVCFEEVSAYSKTSCRFMFVFLLFRSTAFDSSLLSNIQKLFSERIEIFSSVEFSKVSVLTGIIKIGLKVGPSFVCMYVVYLAHSLIVLPNWRKY